MLKFSGSSCCLEDRLSCARARRGRARPIRGGRDRPSSPAASRVLVRDVRDVRFPRPAAVPSARSALDRDDGARVSPARDPSPAMRGDGPNRTAMNTNGPLGNGTRRDEMRRLAPSFRSLDTAPAAATRSSLRARHRLHAIPVLRVACPREVSPVAGEICVRILFISFLSSCVKYDVSHFTAFFNVAGAKTSVD
jgi:hypothetical protein